MLIVNESEFIEFLLELLAPSRIEAAEFGIDRSYVRHLPSTDLVVTFISGERFRVVVTREV